jgi:hypothetical protein
MREQRQARRNGCSEPRRWAADLTKEATVKQREIENEDGTDTARTTRRAMLFASAAGLAAVAAGSVASASPAAAANGSAVLLGQENDATSDTEIVSTSLSTLKAVNRGGGTSLFAFDNGGGGYGSGLGDNPIIAFARGSGNGTGNLNAAIVAVNDGGGPGIEALAKSVAPAIAASSSGSGPSILANDAGDSTWAFGAGTGPALLAQLTNAANPSPAVKATTVGKGSAVAAAVTNAASSATAITASTTGIGSALSSAITNAANAHAAVRASTVGSGPGVFGESTNAAGLGVMGQGTNGATGLYGASDSGDALQVVGKVSLSRSGVATVTAKKKSVKVNLAGVASTSMVLATLQTAAGAIGVANAVPAAGSFSINLTAAPTSAVKVAWMVLG